ncbi:hypothetical protein NE237_014023 [Protea cynaroides]|uniref:Uncharacterized protein n=1 Tax=Protea cynaroides TaxID=273540 RepID=A0A9Q0H102_9MAGN|nr:hypothetical protein NE237_014023 [Protea cynaroides]
MAEVEKSAESVRIGMSINSVTTGETLNKRPLENGLANGDSLKYKRRNVVVKRDFPKGCGRFAERINRFSKVGDGSTKDETIGDLQTVRDSGVLGDSQAPEFLNSSVQAESHTSKTSTTETANCLETSDQVEELEPVKAVEHETSTRIPLALDSETAKPLETSDQMKGLEMVKPLEYETSTHISQQSLVSQSAKPLETSDQVENLEKVEVLEHESSTHMAQALDSEPAKLSATPDKLELPEPTRSVDLEKVKALEHEPSTHMAQALDSETAKLSAILDKVELPESTRSVDLEKVKALEHESSTHMAQALDSETAKLSATLDKVELPEPARSVDLDMVEALEHESSTHMAQALDSKTAKLSDTLDKVKLPEPTRSVEPLKTELSEPSVQIDLLELSKNLELQNTSGTGLVPPEGPVLLGTSKLSKVSDQPQMLIPVGEATEKRRRLVKMLHSRAPVVRQFPPGCGRNAPPMSREEYLKIIGSSKDTSADKGRPSEEHRPFEKSVKDEAGPIPEKVKDEDALSIKLKRNVAKEIGTTGDDFSKKIAEKAPIRIALETRDDAKQNKDKIKERDAPTGKFRGNLSEEIGDKVRVKSEQVFGKEMAGKVQVRRTSDIKLKQELIEETNIRSPRETMLFQSNTNSQSVSNSTLTKEGFAKGKLGKEVNSSKGKTSNRQFHGEIQDEVDTVNQSHRTEIVSFKSSDENHEMVIVQALMAAPYCPWRQGKRAIKSSPTIGRVKNKEKKHELGVQDKSSSFSKKNRDGTGNSKKKKLLPAETDAHQGLGQLVLMDEEDTLGHVMVTKSKKKKLPPAETDAHEGLGQLVLMDEEDTLGYVMVGEDVPLDKKPQKFEVSPIPFGLHTSSGKGDGSKGTREKVRETLRFFQVIFRKFLQGEEAHPKNQGSTSMRIDLRAANVLKKGNKWVNTEKILGFVPGVEVGDEFHYRVELAIVGLHRPFQGGIDSIKKDGKVLATSIVASGGYADDMDSSDVLVYSGQGGKPMGGEKQRQAEDQKLERGNLALKNSMDAGTVVRVIRGFKETSSSDSVDSKGKIITTYIYDGVYLVEDYWTESSTYGTSVFKFKLRRVPGQPELALKEVKKSRKSKVREGLCVVDISQGKEKMLIGAVNTIDDEKPPPFTYITKMIYPDWYNPIPPKGCDCTNGCLNSKVCSCAAKNGGDIPFNFDGAIVEAKPLVYECGPSCSCPPSCHNRVSQRGIKFQLEIFKTESRGWGVRSLTSIPSGSFVCEYTGELLQDKEAEQRTGNDEYLFDIGHNYNDRALWEGLPNVIPDLQTSPLCEVVEDAGYTIDAAQYGSIGRFINHSCSPNLYAQNVLYDHDDKRMPHIMLFAAENIPPLQELTYHYNYTIGQVYDAEGNVKEKRCCCGSADCSGRLY